MERIIVAGIIQGYRVKKGDKSYLEDLRDAFSVEDKSHVIFDEPYDKVKAAQEGGYLMEFIRDHRKQTFANCADVHREVMDALSQDSVD